MPWFIWVIVITQFINYALFGLIQWRQKSNRFKDNYNYIDYEKMYLRLSFTGKAALAGGLGYGLLFRTKDC